MFDIPDYRKLILGMGRVCCWSLLVMIGFALLAALFHVPDAVGTVGAAALVTASVAALMMCRLAWVKETKALRADDPSRREQPASPPRDKDQKRGFRWPGLAFSAITQLGLPLILIGGGDHLPALVVAGVVLLGLAVIDLSIVWPLRRARKSPHDKS